MGHWVYLSSTAAKRYYPESSGNDFTVPLHRPLLLTDMWMCALVQFDHTKPLPQSVKSYMVCTDICQESIVNDFSLPVLTRMTTGQTSKAPLTEIYVPLNPGSIQALRVYIRDSLGHPLPFDLGDVECTVHFVQHGSNNLS